MADHDNAAEVEISANCPWPGLAPFTEDAQNFFHGRTDEIDNLFRLVKRANLSVLFGRSGLGKTSLIKAGLIPILRKEGFLPIYFRIDFQPSTKSPIEQFWNILSEEFMANDIEAPSHNNHETIWEYFHRKENDFWGPRNTLITPFIIFDQFEEIFTHGRNASSSDKFLEQIADLAENRTPKVLSEIIDVNPEKLDEFDFDKDPTKVLLSFREDFLPDFEGCKSFMPSIMRERMRLTTMSSSQGRDVILKSGGALIDESVTDKIIMFITGSQQETASPDQREVEPALISVVCHELNERRLEAKRDCITDDLLESARGEIIASFYDSSVTQVNDATREFIENELLTEGGFRNSCAIADATNTPGVTLEAIERLIDCRLLRREIYLGTMRLELTHDLLVPVIKERRDQRRLARTQLKQRRKVQSVVGILAIILCGMTGGAAYYAHRKNVALDLAIAEKEEKTALYAEKDKLYADLDRSIKEKEAAQVGAITNYNVALEAAAKNADIIKKRVSENKLNRKIAVDLLVNWRSMLDGLKLDSPSQDALQAEVKLTKSLFDVYAQLNDTDGMARATRAQEALADRIQNGFPESITGRRTHAQSLTSQSRMQLAKGDLADAETNARNALRENKIAVEMLPSNVAPNRILARDHFLLGRVLARRHKLKDAETELRTALNLFEPDANIPLIQREAASVRRELARVLARQGQIDASLAEIGQSLSILKGMPDDNTSYKMARTIQGTIVLSNIQHLKWSIDEANLSIEEAEALLKKWHKQDQDHAEWNDLYLWTQRSKGELLLSLGRYDEASQTLRKGISNYKYTSSETNDYNITIHDYVLSYCALSKISPMVDKKLVSEKTLHDMRTDVSDILSRHSSFVEGKYLIATIDFCLGDLAKENKKLTESLARYASGIETLSSLVLDHPDDVQWQWDLAMAKMSESFIQAKAGKAEANSRYEGSREALKKIQMANPSLIQWQKSFDQIPAFPEVKK